MQPPSGKRRREEEEKSVLAEEALCLHSKFVKKQPRFSKKEAKLKKGN